MSKTTFWDLGDRLKHIDHSLSPKLDQAFDVKNLYKDSTENYREKIAFTNKNGAIYLGRIPKTREQKKVSIYNRESLKRMIAEIFPKIADGEKLTIFDGSEVGNIIASDVDEVYLQGQEVIDFLEDIADEVEPNWSSKIDVKQWNGSHPQLFTTLRKDSIDDFIVIDQEPALSENTTSLEIFRFLSWIIHTEDGKTIAQLAEDTIPKQRKEKADINLSTDRLYALCEISCRIVDLMNGRYIQGGVWRQALYDRLLVYIVTKKFTKDTPMWRLQQHILVSPDVHKFIGFYYNDDVGIINQEKKIKQKNTRSTIRNAWLIALFSLMSVLGYKQVSNYKENIRLKNANEQLIKDLIRETSIVEYVSPLDISLRMEYDKEKLDVLINDDVDQIKQYYKDRFGGWGDMTETEFEWRILDNLTIDQLKKMHHYASEHSKKVNEFIDQVLIPQSQFSFIASKVPTQAYTWLADRENDMINTLKTGKLGTNKHPDSGSDLAISIPDRSYLLYDGDRVNIPFNAGGEYFVVTNTYDGAIDTNLTYKTIVDYFIQTRPGYRKVAEVLETYMIHSRDYIYDHVEDTKREEADKINFMSNLIVNRVYIPVNDDVEVLRILKKIFVDSALGEDFSKYFARYNMFAGEFLTDTTILENTRNNASMMYSTYDHDPSEFKKVWQYPYIGHHSNNKLVFYEVIKANIKGQRIYFARPVRTGDAHRDAYNPLMLHTFLTEDLSQSPHK